MFPIPQKMRTPITQSRSVEISQTTQTKKPEKENSGTTIQPFAKVIPKTKNVSNRVTLGRIRTHDKSNAKSPRISETNTPEPSFLFEKTEQIKNSYKPNFKVTETLEYFQATFQLDPKAENFDALLHFEVRAFIIKASISKITLPEPLPTHSGFYYQLTMELNSMFKDVLSDVKDENEFDAAVQRAVQNQIKALQKSRGELVQTPVVQISEEIQQENDALIDSFKPIYRLAFPNVVDTKEVNRYLPEGIKGKLDSNGAQLRIRVALVRTLLANESFSVTDAWATTVAKKMSLDFEIVLKDAAHMPAFYDKLKAIRDHRIAYGF
ncbi:hypothetical protein [Variovorax sp. KK3]|uniref:hypothetical protein n=1 Tax=Variovorax sp. KK3 TaxID=1855728 RepID=UPI00117C21C2|nr:hypothetical protein [Variovorax sp. KK3]